MRSTSSFFLERPSDAAAAADVLDSGRVAVTVGGGFDGPSIHGAATDAVVMATNLLRAVVRPDVLAGCDYAAVSAAVAGCLRDVSAEVDEWARLLNAEAAVADWNAARQEAIDEARENDHAA